MDRSASSSEPRSNSREITQVARWDVKLTDVLSTARFDTQEWKIVLDTVHQYHVMYRLLWVNRVVEHLRTKYKSKDDMLNLLELLLGFEDRAWRDSEGELQYASAMNSFTVFCSRPDRETWPHLVRQGRNMDLLKDILRYYLVNTLPTVYWIDKQRDLYLLVGSQHTHEIQALFRQLTVAWNSHSARANPERLVDLPAHYIAEATMDLAFGPTYTAGAALNVFEGIINSSTGLGVALLPAPIEEYLQLLWLKQVHYSISIQERQAMNQNALKVVMPWMTCSGCSLAKEVGVVFGLRNTEANARFVPIMGPRMEHILSRIEFFRRVFRMTKVIEDLKPTLDETSMVCCHGQGESTR